MDRRSVVVHRVKYKSWGAVIGVACALLAPRGALAEAADESRARVGFSTLVTRLNTDEIGIAKEEFRVHILEALRDAGFNAVGAESLVFNKDEGDRADFVLGGTVRELACRDVERQTNCRIGIDWELLDRARDEVVYQVRSRNAAFDVDLKASAAIGRRLVLGAALGRGKAGTSTY
jgi:hypothetical protein